MNTANASMLSLESRHPETSLDRRFGRIALSALVAVLPYTTETKNHVSTPTETRN